MKKIIVDDDTCIGCGFCCSSSDNFEMNDEGRAYSVDENFDIKNEEEKEELTNILEGCPVGAIKIIEENE